jgi:hypothetical protein
MTKEHKAIPNYFSSSLSASSNINLNKDPAFKISFQNNFKPFQPILEFHVKNSRSFNKKWYESFQWLEYSIEKNAAFCFYCRFFAHNSHRNDSSFSSRGFSNFKNAIKGFRDHEATNSHKTSEIMYLNRTNIENSVGSSCVSQLNSNFEKNREYLLKVIETVVYLGKQGLPFKGHREDAMSNNRGNFLELIQLRSLDSQILAERCDNLTCKYTSPQIQNELISLLSEQVISNILPKDFFSVIVDETTDVSRHEQVSICVRYFSQLDNKVHEHFLGFVRTNSTTSSSLFELLVAKLNSFHLNFKKYLIGQCFDGAATMSGSKNGLQSKVREIVPQALFIHCYCHQLNLSLISACNNHKSILNCMNTVNDLHTFIERSAKRHGLFEHLQDASNQVILKALSDTRWSERDTAFKAMIKCYDSVITFLTIVDEEENNQCGAKASGLLAVVKTFDFLFFVNFISNIFDITSILHKVLQDSEIDIVTALEFVETTLISLNSMLIESFFEVL